FFGPPVLPKSITDTLHATLQEALHDSSVSASLAAAGLEAAPMSASAFAQRCSAERHEMAAILNQLELA
ncbi:MAG TPA: tripartite tricarboxylate transporter substrate binding protein, partial [Bordetella sp.]|nr:tripartite tricarboxylate transporter substrate binding protein [Bordetella sp.]